MIAVERTAWLTGTCRALAVAMIFLLTGCGERISRDDFTAAVKDNSTSEVTARFGNPDAVDESADNTVKWTYKSRTFGVESGGTKLDARTIVVFRKSGPDAPARVVEVLYE